ncbi:ABC transporter ATP-binding protein, partial [bacterium]|nr:ABC transporter ATP-binding protein [bacterium]
MKNLLKLSGSLKGIYPRLFLIAVFSLLFAAINSLWPIFTKWIVDTGPSFVTGKTIQQVIPTIGLIFVTLSLLAFLMSLFDGLSWWLTDKTYNLANDRLFRVIFLRSQQLSHHYYEANSSGKIQEKINAGINGLLSWIMMVSQNLLDPGGVILFSLAIITWTSPATGLLVLISLVFYVWDFRIANFKAKQPRKDVRRADEKRYGLISEGFSHYATIRSLSAESTIRNRIFRQSHTVLELNNKLTNIWSWSISRRLFVSRLVAFAAICMQLFELWQGRATTGDIVMIMLYINQINGNILFFSRFLIATAENETKAERLLSFLENTPII